MIRTQLTKSERAFDSDDASSKKAPRQRGVCVKHLKRCKTSNCWLHFFTAYSSFRKFDSADSLVFVDCVSFHFITQGVPGALMRPALTKTLISCLWYRWGRSSTYLLHFHDSFLRWDVANPRTTMTFPNNLFSIFSCCTVFAICQGGNDLALLKGKCQLPTLYV